MHISTRRGLLAISPICVFLLFYLVVSLAIGDFYKMPISVALLVASAWAMYVLRGRTLTERIEVFSAEAGSSNVLYMIWIFVLAGAFAALAREVGSVQATVNAALQFLPVEMLIPGLFIAACFISLSIGTSVGTVVALTPLAVEIADAGGESVPFFVAVVLGGAFFGDNLSFISDTTIAATRTQHCKMSDKFKTNFVIVLPAALLALGLYVVLGVQFDEVQVDSNVNYWLIVPYLVVIITALMGINVTVVLSLGIITALVIAMASGYDLIDLFGFMGKGIDEVGNLVIITLLAAGLLGVIKAAHGLEFILSRMSAKVRGPRGAQASVACLVGLVNLCTANNTVAILTVGELAAGIGHRFGVDPRKMASLLDTSSCIIQSMIPYGAQTLLATSLAGISPEAPWIYLYYPWFLIIMVALSIIFRFPRKSK